MSNSASAPLRRHSRPFGLTLAVPTGGSSVEGLIPVLSLCPERQVTVTSEGEPFIHAPSMKSAFETVSQTQEDMQLFDDKTNDKD
ncbi:putative ATP-grasp-modified RiPP [Streptomyces litchfieldiae]|uniref:ATP-grasp-modified RiPP n=1 Tax=Streptomyces litchfieldiae TaxID=3075543 RepID=A0ABU2MYC2_9ACTN|nr:putative ATP-grasp-modified RiPP [Streptomyces sp. DSM 44938]MDT0345803.1 putative ATP-grasp-modified RiPP [Streptomyces sp. DSM 44938]